MKIKIIRELSVQRGTPDNPEPPIVELLMEVDEELLETYRSETGDYNNPPNKKELDGWFNGLVEYALRDGEDDWKY